MELLLQLVLLCVGFVMLIKGADWFVDGASGIASKFGIPQLVIGLTIVAMGTSAPEAAISIAAAFKGSADITIGNVVGSNIMNVLVILGLTAMITPLAVGKSTLRIEIPFVIVISLILLALGFDGSIGTIDGVILWGIFIVYLAYLFYLAKHGNGDSEEEEQKKMSFGMAIVWTLIGLVLVVIGSDVTVDAATAIAKMFGMTERFIGLTIVAFGTSLPELVTSITAAKKGSVDIAIGNIVGSNVFNFLFVVGTSALVIPVTFATAFRLDVLVAVAAMILLLVCCIKDKKLKRLGGAIMLAAYAAYFFLVCL